MISATVSKLSDVISRKIISINRVGSISIAPSSDSDVARSYRIHHDCDGVHRQGHITKAIGLEPRYSTITTYLCAISKEAQEYDETGNPLFLFYMSYIEFHEITHVFEDVMTVDDVHSDQWFIVFSTIVNHIEDDWKLEIK